LGRGAVTIAAARPRSFSRNFGEIASNSRLLDDVAIVRGTFSPGAGIYEE
jgi:hypothetical protein